MRVLFIGGPANGQVRDHDFDDPAMALPFFVDGQDSSTGCYNLVGQLPLGSAAEWQAKWFKTAPTG